MVIQKQRFAGIDMGAETIKLVVCEQDRDDLQIVWRDLREHHKKPAQTLEQMLQSVDWSTVQGAAATGRLSRLLTLPRIPIKQAQVAGFRQRHPGQDAATVVSIGSHGFSVLEIREAGVEVFRENSRCSQGTGNFLRQLVERFDLGLDEAATLCEPVTDPAPLSGRCPVILKTDMTHLANKGEDRSRILAGLYDAVCENVQVLIKPRLTPADVLLVGGVSRATRVRERFAAWLETHAMRVIEGDDTDRLFIEAVGCAAIAARDQLTVPARTLFAPPQPVHLDRIPGLAQSLPRVHRMKAPARPSTNGKQRDILLGFDMGSTGSKALTIDRETREILWQSYLNTNGNPVAASQALMSRFVESPVSQHRLRGIGVTGSGREIVGSLLSTCYGPERVFVLNEIAAHAEGAQHYDDRVDTIFEIGGQDAKYIRLTGGRVTDAAMNEACSAGTGSFIEEQGRKFSGIRDVVHLGEVALTAELGISLGQHCSVFMAEVIDEAVAAGAPQNAIIAGIYDSIIQNYLNRVKGTRDVGQRIFCQGMPFSSDALAAAVARQTGSEVIIPPDPGTVGALGISLLARRFLSHADTTLEAARYLDARVLRKDTFVCKSKQGCGGSGNKCRIDRIKTEVAGEKKKFLWGGNCSLYDRGTGKKKLPDLTPDPFREREALIGELIEQLTQSRPVGGLRPSVGLTDEFALKSLFPFFATFLREMGFDLVVRRGAGQSALKRGIEEANVPFCAPMQQYHGLMAELAEEEPDFLFMPMIRTLPRIQNEDYATLCPIVQGSPDIMRWDLGQDLKSQILSPVIDMGQGDLRSDLFRQSCTRLAQELGVDEASWTRAFDQALANQERFDDACLALGQSALDFCRQHDIVPVIILGRAYTIYNNVLNSNVPAITREQGALPIPVDCYPVTEAPIFEEVYWGYAQRSLRAAHQIRRTPGQYAIYCSNYSCGPDSFNLHFFSYAMDGRPFAIIETDGHSGDAGTKTRVEAFLHCVREDLRALHEPHLVPRPIQDFNKHVQNKASLKETRERDEIVLFPRMGPGAEVVAAAFRGQGIRAECLPLPDADALELGRRQTSGKECVPMTITAGSLLQRLQQAEAAGSDDRFCFFMPTANGPCRFGVYNLVHKIIVERLGLEDRCRVFSPSDDDYFAEVDIGFEVLVWTGFMANDLLLEGFYHARPAELERGATQRIYEQYTKRLNDLVENAARGDLSLKQTLFEISTGRLFGIPRLLERAGKALADAHDADRDFPTVLVVGEIYVRCDPFANGFVIDKLEERGVRAKFAPFNEWIEYTDLVTHVKRKEGTLAHPEKDNAFTARITSTVLSRIQNDMYDIMARALRWPARTTVDDSLKASAPYMRNALYGECVLTLGGPIFEHREGHIQGVVSVGPLECMPNKLSESQFFHVAEQEGLLSLTLQLNGEPFDIEVLENFIYEIKERHREDRQRRPDHRAAPHRPSLAARAQNLASSFGYGLAYLMAGRALTEFTGVPQAWTASPQEDLVRSLPEHRRRLHLS